MIYLRLTIATTCLIASTPLVAADTYRINIEPQPLTTALQQFAQQSGLQIVYYGAVADGYKANRLVGNLTAAEALQKLLAGTDLQFETLDQSTIAISSTKDGSSAASKQTSTTSIGVERQGIRLAQADTGSSSQGERSESRNSAADGSSAAAEKVAIEEVTVTGTNIRGVTDGPSPVEIYTDEDLRNRGIVSSAEFLESLTQNFSVGGLDTSIMTGDVANKQNTSSATSANLRGIGSKGSLVLLNGRRMAAGSRGFFVDTSLIPFGAIDRIEVLTDGASAIYGSDAISGVMNFVLRKDYDGAETRVGNRWLADSNVQRFYVSQTLGESWSSGNALIAGSYGQDDALSAYDRSYMTPAAPLQVTPEQQSYSVFGSVTQDITPSTKLDITALYSNRRPRQIYTYPPSVPTLSTRFDMDTQGISAGVTQDLWSGWKLGVDLNYSRFQSDRSYTSAGFPATRTEYFRGDTYEATAKADGIVASLPAGEVRMAIGVNGRREEFEDAISSNLVLGFPPGAFSRDLHAVFSEFYVPLLAGLPAIRRLDLSVAGRYEDYSDAGSHIDPKVGLVWEASDEFLVRGTYGTSFSASLYVDTLTAFNSTTVRTLSSPSCASGTCVIVSEGGARRDYEPETATTYTLGFEYKPSWAPALSFSANYYSIDYENRIASLPFTRAQLVNNPGLFPDGVVANPSADFLAEVFARAQGNLQGDKSLGTRTADDIDFYLDTRTRNLASTSTSGFDTALRYQFEQGPAHWFFELKGTFIADLENQASSASSVLDTLSTYANPIDRRLQFTTSYTNNALTLTSTVEYIGDYTNTQLAARPKIGSWTTWNATARYSFFGDLISNADITLTAKNILNEAPPFAPDGLTPLNFDSANANPYGRIIGLELAKRW